MATRRLARVQLSSETQSRLSVNGIQTVGDLYYRSHVELCEVLDMNISDVTSIIQTVALSIPFKWRTVYDIYHRANDTAHLSVCSAVAGLTIPTNGLTELVGTGGAGKSQLCATLTANLLLSTASGTVLLIDTEGAFSPERLAQIISEQLAHKNVASDNRAEQQLHALLARVTLLSAPTFSELVAHVNALESVCIDSDCRLLIIDGIARPTRHHFQHQQLPQRAAALAEIASKLKYLSDRLALPVIVTNQVATHFVSGDSADSIITAALGVNWAHAVNMRLIVDMHTHTQRRIRLAKSPTHAYAEYAFAITDAGCIVDSLPLPLDNRLSKSVIDMNITSAVNVHYT